MAGWTKSINLVGAPGFSVQAGNGAPASTLGNVGDIYIDLQNSVIYAQKTSTGWPTSGTSFKGATGASTAATLPNDITANSVSVAPVSGDTTAVSISLGNGSNILFNVNAQGALTAASSNITGNESVGGAFSVTGATTLSGTLKVTGQSTLGAASVTSLTNSGTGTAASYQTSANGSVGAPAFAYSNQADTGAYLATASTSAAVLGFAANGTLALSLSKTGVSIPGTLNVSGASTVASLSAQSITTANFTNTGSNSAAGISSTIAGTATAPAFFFAAQTDTGVYLATTSSSAAVLGLTVNGVQALALAKGGITVPGTLSVTGNTSLGQTATGALTAASATVSGQTNVQALSAGAITAASCNTTGGVAVGGVLQVSGNETIGGTSTITGLVTASAGVTTPVVTTTQAPTSKTVTNVSYTVSNVTLPGSFGDGNSYPPSGLSADTLGNLALNYMGVPAIKMANPGYSSAAANTPGSSFPTNFLSGSYNFNVGGTPQLSISSSAVKFGFTSNTIPVTMQAFSGNILQLQNGGSSPNFTTTTVGTVDTSGNATFAGVLKGTSVTFGDGTNQTTAFTATAASNQQRYYANANGTTALPSLTFSANTDTGVYLKTASTSAAVMGLSVNAADALTMTTSGVSIPGTLAVTGTTTLTGALTAAAIAGTSATLSGTVKGAALTITASGGALTFGDGTTQTTAAGTVTAGSAAKFSATSNGTAAAPVFTFSNQTDSGMYLGTQSTSAAVLNWSLNGTSVASLGSAGLTVPALSSNGAISGTNGTLSGTLTVTGTANLNGTTNLATTTASSVQVAGQIKAANGTVSAPGVSFSNDLTSGFYFTGGSPGTLYTSIKGAQVASITTGAFNITGYIQASSVVSGSTLTATTAGGTATATSFGSANANGYGLYINTSASTPYTGLSTGSTSYIQGTASAATLPLPTTHSSTTTLTGATTAAATITSTTAAGTPSFVSSQGFKQTIAMGSEYAGSNSAVNNSNGFNYIYITSSTNSGVTQGTFVAPYAGSVIGMSVYDVQNTAGKTYRFSIAGTTQGTIASSTSNSYSATYTKGTYAFTAGQAITMDALTTTAGTISQAVGYLIVEMGA